MKANKVKREYKVKQYCPCLHSLGSDKDGSVQIQQNSSLNQTFSPNSKDPVQEVGPSSQCLPNIFQNSWLDEASIQNVNYGELLFLDPFSVMDMLCPIDPNEEAMEISSENLSHVSNIYSNSSSSDFRNEYLFHETEEENLESFEERKIREELIERVLELKERGFFWYLSTEEILKASKYKLLLCLESYPNWFLTYN
jgi:hypothetical protein